MLYLWNTSELKSKKKQQTILWLTKSSHVWALGKLLHAQFMNVAWFGVHFKWVLGCLLGSLMVENCNDACKRFWARLLHLAQSWWWWVVDLGWLPILILYPQANAWLKPRGKQLLRWRWLCVGRGSHGECSQSSLYFSASIIGTFGLMC